MSVFGKAVCNGVPIALLYDETASENKFVITCGYREDGSPEAAEQSWRYPDLKSAMKDYLDFENTGLRSFA